VVVTLRIGHRLPAARQVDDAQRRVSESNLRAKNDTGPIGLAVSQLADHLARQSKNDGRGLLN
jgi:hypothetical protein